MGPAAQFENGVVPADLLSNKYGHRLHFWNLRELPARFCRSGHTLGTRQIDPKPTFNFA